MPDKVKILHVDDSAVIRSIIKRIIESDSNCELIASARDGQDGVDAYKTHAPDIVVLDIEMPVMNGMQALEKIIQHDPQAKVIMCSTLTVDNAEITLKALKMGALDYIAKPTSANDVNSSDEFRSRLLYLVKNIKKDPKTVQEKTMRAGMPVPDKPVDLRPKPMLFWKPKLIAIGSSTGGPQALVTVLKDLKDIKLPIVITQHMPPTFTKMLAKSITEQTGVLCHEAEDGMALKPGEIILAKGGKHLGFVKNADGQVMTKLSDDDPVNYCKPAVDPMYKSLTHHYGGNILSVILTGMGNDGLHGVEEITNAGGFCIAQDQDTSVVWGMPGSVATKGLCSAVLPLDGIAEWIKTNVNISAI